MYFLLCAHWEKCIETMISIGICTICFASLIRISLLLKTVKGISTQFAYQRHVLCIFSVFLVCVFFHTRSGGNTGVAFLIHQYTQILTFMLFCTILQAGMVVVYIPIVFIVHRDSITTSKVIRLIEQTTVDI